MIKTVQVPQGSVYLLDVSQATDASIIEDFGVVFAQNMDLTIKVDFPDNTWKPMGHVDEVNDNIGSNWRKYFLNRFLISINSVNCVY